jgi:penicillin-insensitive murein endopeptidase
VTHEPIGNARRRRGSVASRTRRAIWLGAVALLLAADQPTAAHAASRCFGSVGNGRIEESVALPGGGSNFSAYSALATLLGRNHVHSEVATTVTAAYAALAADRPATHYVYGESGWPRGGRLRPHRTHQNGTSVDFFVPVRGRDGQSVALPTSVATRYGYDLQFDDEGRLGELQIDFDAIADHLHALQRAAQVRRTGIALVIFDTRYLPKLFATPRGESLKSRLRFLPRQAWVRHDEHYHVDFAIRCAPLK